MWHSARMHEQSHDRSPITSVAAAATRLPSPALTETVQRTWAEFLDVAGVGPHDDFFDLGGNSLIVAEALAKLGERVGIDLPLRALFEAPTPAEMAELIEELRAGPPAATGPIDGFTPFHAPWVVPLQREGTKRPVWVVPGGMGGVWTLKRDAQVASLVGRDHPFFGFQRDPAPIPRGADNWIAQMASAYVEQMRLIQGSGPYLIYGICNGGSLAWETARQLLAGGDDVAGVLFYEVALAADFASAEPRQRPGRMPHYLPQALPVDLTLLMTEVWHANDRSAGWRGLATGGVTTVVMPGDTPGAHNLYVNREPMIAGHLRDWIERSESRRRRE
jgi:acyl carrier protein